MRIPRLLRLARSIVLLSFTLPCIISSASAGTATWDLKPAGGVWNNPANWTPATVPNGPSDVATFSLSNRTDVSLASSVEVSAIDFTAGAGAFNISAGPGTTLTISGSGVSNASGVTQTFTVADNENGTGAIMFMNSATAGDGNLYRNKGDTFGFTTASTQFFGTSNAGTSTIINTNPGKSFMLGGFTAFFDQSSAANSAIINEVPPTGDVLDGFPSTTAFHDNSTAGNAILIAKGSEDATGDTWSEIDFLDQSTADHATITLEGGGVTGVIRFEGNSTGGNATLTMQGAPVEGNYGAFGQFLGSATAGNAIIILEGGEGGAGAGAFLYFYNTSSGGQAAFTVKSNAVLDMSSHSAPGMPVGSLAGDGMVQVGSLALTIGTNNQNTKFAGTIQDSTSHTGSLIKTGTGRLSLSGANTFGGGTTVDGGALLANNTTGSATGTGAVTVTSGTLGGGGIISGGVTVSGAAILAPAFGSNKQLTLTLQSSLTLQTGATYFYSFKARASQTRSDLVTANGVTIAGATIELEAKIESRLTVGTILTVISNSSANPISGTFSNLPDGAVVNVSGNNLQANYSGGDGNDLTLTVVP